MTELPRRDFSAHICLLAEAFRRRGARELQARCSGFAAT